MEVTSIVLDVNTYTAFKKGDPTAVNIIKQVPTILINPIILGELLGGFLLGSRQEKNEQELELFLNSDRVKVVDIDKDTSKFYGEIYKELRAKGKPIPTNDLWIAATAKQYDSAIFSYDSHFENISNLKVVTRLSDLTFK